MLVVELQYIFNNGYKKKKLLLYVFYDYIILR